MMTTHIIGMYEEWLAARLELFEAEKKRNGHLVWRHDEESYPQHLDWDRPLLMQTT